MFHHIEQNVVDWARERGIYSHSTPQDQFSKLLEEVSELHSALCGDSLPDIIDGIGDCLVVLTNIAHQYDINLTLCYSSAYSEIHKRTGEMREGKFVKDK